MKKLITLLLLIIVLSANAQNTVTNTPPKESKFSLNFGGGYVNWGGEENGYIAFNEFQYHFTSRVSAGTNLYFAKTKYGLDSKNNPTFFTGIDLNAYYTIFKNEKFRESIGAGYAFRFENSTYSENYPNNVTSKGATINLLIEGKVSEHFGIGFKAAWQPFGTYNALIYGGLYGTVKF